jgi:hypothetical protein
MLSQTNGPSSEKDARLAQKLGQLQPFSCIPTGLHGPTRIFWANLTPFSLRAVARADTIGCAVCPSRARDQVFNTLYCFLVKRSSRLRHPAPCLVTCHAGWGNNLTDLAAISDW